MNLVGGSTPSDDVLDKALAGFIQWLWSSDSRHYWASLFLRRLFRPVAAMHACSLQALPQSVGKNGTCYEFLSMSIHSFDIFDKRDPVRVEL